MHRLLCLRNREKLCRSEGLGGFYKGLGPSLLRVVPASAITFVVYEQTLNFFRDMAAI